MGTKAFPAASSLKREELEKASPGAGSMPARYSCAEVLGDVAKTRNAMPAVTTRRMLCVIARPHPTCVAGIPESP